MRGGESRWTGARSVIRTAVRLREEVTEGIREAAVLYEIAIRHPDARLLVVLGRVDAEMCEPKGHVLDRDEVDLLSVVAEDAEEIGLSPVIA